MTPDEHQPGTAIDPTTDSGPSRRQLATGIVTMAVTLVVVIAAVWLARPALAG